MNTTSLLIEYVVIGFQTFLWMLILACSLFGFRWITIDLAQINGIESAAGILFILTPFVYPLGVIVDNISDDIFRNYHNKIRNKYVTNKISTMDIYVKHSEIKFLNYLEYVRTRIRLSRSSAVNFFIITISLIVFTISPNTEINKNNQPTLILIELVAGTIFTACAVFVWYRVSNTFYKQLKHGLKALGYNE